MPRHRFSLSRTLRVLKGNRWATGRTDEAPEDPLIKAEEAMGREWFAIVAFPLFAGTFGTIASALNICALVQPWRCVVVDGVYNIKDIPDPGWLRGLNALSLFTGFIANLAMLPVVGDGSSGLAKYGIRRLHLILITIVGGFIASFILIGLIVATAVNLRLPSPPEHAFTEAFYYAIMAAVVYFTISAFIVYTAYMLWSTQRTREEPRTQFVQGHRSLKLLTMLFMAYMLLGAAVYSKIEDWRYVDAVFWADTTLLTIGFGSFKPITHLGRCLLFPYASCGIVILLLVIYCTTNIVFKRGKSLWEVRLRDQERIRSVYQRSKKSNQTGNEKPQGHSYVVESDEARINEERETRRRDFKAMQLIMVKAARKRVLFSTALWAFFAFFLWFVGAVVFFVAEEDTGWSYFDALYFTFISLLAIGYGDNGLQSMAGKAFFVLWSLIVVPTLTMLIATLTEAVGMPDVSAAKRWYRKRVLKKQDDPKIQRHLSQSLMPTEQLSKNTYDKNHLLVQAIKAVTIDHIKNQQTNSQQDYSFEDWEYIFYLLGVLEPLNEERKAPIEGSNRELKPTRSHLEEWRDGGQILDWLHGKNPLNVSDTLTEWVLLNLVDKLETELFELRKQMQKTSVE